MLPPIVNPNEDLAEEFANSEEAKALLEEFGKASGIVEDAATRAPYKTGDLAEGVFYEVGFEAGVGWIGRLGDEDFKAHFWEFGTSRNDAIPYLRPAAEAAGLTFDPEGA